METKIVYWGSRGSKNLFTTIKFGFPQVGVPRHKVGVGGVLLHGFSSVLIQICIKGEG